MSLKISKCMFPLMKIRYENIFQLNKVGSLCFNARCLCKSSSDCGGKNQVLVLNAAKDLRFESRPIPKYQDHQVLLQMGAVGVCQSDLWYYLEGKIGPSVLTGPMVLGHESSGTVVECGKNVKHLRPGDKVAVEPQKPCRRCQFCKLGRYNLCPSLVLCGVPPHDGTLCTYFAHDADFCHKLPCNIDEEHGALIEPLALGVHACKKIHVSPGDAVLIFGSGPVGLSAAMASKCFGASHVVIVDMDECKLSKAKLLGFKSLINFKGMSDEQLLKTIYEKFGKRPDKAIDGSGANQAQKLSIIATRNGGEVAFIGYTTKDGALPLTRDVISRELNVYGVHRYCNDYPTAIDMVALGKIDPKPMVTHHVAFKDAIKVFEMAACKKEPFVKIIIHANPNWKPKEKDC